MGADTLEQVVVVQAVGLDVGGKVEERLREAAAFPAGRG